MRREGKRQTKEGGVNTNAEERKAKGRKGKQREEKEWKGKEREEKGREGKGRKGKEREAKGSKGKERKGKERKGKERKVPHHEPLTLVHPSSVIAFTLPCTCTTQSLHLYTLTA